MGVAGEAPGVVPAEGQTAVDGAAGARVGRSQVEAEGARADEVEVVQVGEDWRGGGQT